jgi:hypothetical protein
VGKKVAAQDCLRMRQRVADHVCSYEFPAGRGMSPLVFGDHLPKDINPNVAIDPESDMLHPIEVSAWRIQ